MTLMDDIKTNPVLLTGVVVGIIGIGVALYGHFSKHSKAITYCGVALAIGSFAVAFGSKYMPMPKPEDPPTNRFAPGVGYSSGGVTTPA